MTAAVYNLVAWSDRVLVDWAFDLLTRLDKDFVPPLSCRTGTRVNFATASQPLPGREGIEAYFEDLRKQHLVFARIAGVPAGFLSFRHESEHPGFGSFLPINYISTICIEPHFRGHGIGAGFYRFMLNELPLDHRRPYTGTRTWSTNSSHIHLLQKIGFEVAKVVPNDRCEGIDTVYFYRETPSYSFSTSVSTPQT